MAGFLKFYQKILAPHFSGASVSSNIVRVSTVAQLEAAIAAQKAKQIIEIEPGVYQLTKSSPILVAASYGVMRGIGDVQIDGFATADECFEIDPAVATGTFKYTFDNIRVRGATAKAGITIDNLTIGKKIVVVFRDCSLGGTPAVNQKHSDTTEAIRIYCDGWKGDKRYQGSFNITPGSADDRYVFKGVDMSAAGMVIGAAAKACYILWRNCIIKKTNGISGGNAANITACINGFSYESGVLAAAHQDDFETDVDVLVPA